VGLGLKSVGLDYRDEVRRALEDQRVQAEQQRGLQLMMGGPARAYGVAGAQGPIGPVGEDRPARRPGATYSRPQRAGP